MPRARLELAWLPATPSKWCVYQFRHLGKVICRILNRRGTEDAGLQKYTFSRKNRNLLKLITDQIGTRMIRIRRIHTDSLFYVVQLNIFKSVLICSIRVISVLFNLPSQWNTDDTDQTDSHGFIFYVKYNYINPC